MRMPLGRGGVLFLLSAACAAGQISVFPQQVTLAAAAGSATPVSQTVSLTSGGQSLPVDVSVRYLTPAGGWLSVSPATGVLPLTVTLTANPSNLAPGTYTAQVIVSAGSQQTGSFVNVLFAVGSVSSGTLAADPSGLTFVLATQEPSSQSISVASPKGQAAGFTASASSSGWLSVSSEAVASGTPLGSASGATPATLTVTARPFPGMAPGRYDGAITLTPAAGGTPAVAPVTLVITGTTGTPAALQLSQSAVTINHQLGTSAPPGQVVSVLSTDVTATVFTASTLSSWIRLVSPGNPSPADTLTDFLPGQFTVGIDPSGLGAGTYTGTVTVSAPGIPSQQLPVALTVTTTPSLNVTPSSVTLAGTGVISSDVSVVATGGASLTFTAVVGPAVSWLSVAPASGSTAAGSQTLTITANATALATGTYTANVVLTAPGGAVLFTIPVRFEATGAVEVTGSLDVSPASLELAALAGGPSPTAIIDVLPGENGPALDFTAAASSPTGWLTVEPFSGKAPTKVKVTANPAAVSGAGAQSGSVIVTSLVSGAVVTVPVTFTVSAQAIVTQPASLAFTQEKKGVAPPPQTLQIRANSVSAFIISNLPGWIKITGLPSSASPPKYTGVTPADALVSVDPAGLPPGTHTGTIQIAGPNNTLAVPVSLTIPEPPAPTAAPASITITHELGNPVPISQAIGIGSTSDPLTFTASAATESGVNWLTVDPLSGGTPSTLTVKVNPALLVAGRQSGTITVASADPSARPLTIPVTLNVSAASVAVGTVLNAATLAPTSVAPAEIATLTGAGLGPPAGALARPTAAGSIETLLADVRVTFDGVPAPLLFVRNDQINAIAPYALFGRLSARLQVQVGASYSIPIELKVVDTAPGIFTVSGSGRGQAAALNADFTVNSLANPAQRGSVVSLFGTGEGQTDLPGQDGRIIATDLRRPRLPVTAKIGGRPAEVTYAGSAPSLVSGVLQVNVRIPQDVDPGAAPVELQIGGAVSQLGVTIAVR